MCFILPFVSPNCNDGNAHLRKHSVLKNQKQVLLTLSLWEIWQTCSLPAFPFGNTITALAPQFQYKTQERQPSHVHLPKKNKIVAVKDFSLRWLRSKTPLQAVRTFSSLAIAKKEQVLTMLKNTHFRLGVLSKATACQDAYTECSEQYLR